MPIDVSQFYQAFYEESLEMLKGMEEALLQLDPAQVESEKINIIFRAIHSIKGGSAALGFDEISTFSHTVETFLSQVRSGTRKLTKENISLLFRVIDCIVEMIGNLQNNKPINLIHATELENIFHNILQENPALVDEIQLESIAIDEKIFPEPSEDKKKQSLLIDIEQEQQKTPIKNDYKSGITTIRVAVNKIDLLVNQVIEIVITQSILNQLASSLIPSNIEQLKEELLHLNRNLIELQESVMHIRMLPIGFVFQPLHRMVRETMIKLGKEVELKISGEETELDKIMMEHINDPIMHLVRNSLDHGIELPQIRQERGKSAVGLLQLSAQQEGGSIIIMIEDDGGGIDAEKILTKAKKIGLVKPDEVLNKEQIYSLLFRPGFSTKEKVTELSGRGVGLDVVQKNIHAIGGDIEIKSVLGEGTTFILKFPLTLAIMECQLVKIGDDIFIVPLISLIEIIKVESQHVSVMGDDLELYQLRGEYIPILYLNTILKISTQKSIADGFILIVEIEGQRYGLLVDDLLGQQQIAIKSLEENYQRIPGISGATILGDGSIGLILDVHGIITLANNSRLMETKEWFDESNKIEDIIEKEITLPKSLDLLSFKLGDQEYAIDMRTMIEIRNIGKTTKLPRAAPYVKGVTNVHGALIPVVNLRERFNLHSDISNKDSEIMYVLKLDINGRVKTVGILVDAIGDSYTIEGENLKFSPHLAESILTRYVKYVATTHDKRMLTVIETTDLVPFKETEDIGA